MPCRAPVGLTTLGVAASRCRARPVRSSSTTDRALDGGSRDRREPRGCPRSCTRRHGTARPARQAVIRRGDVRKTTSRLEQPVVIGPAAGQAEMTRGATERLAGPRRRLHLDIAIQDVHGSRAGIPVPGAQQLIDAAASLTSARPPRPPGARRRPYSREACAARRTGSYISRCDSSPAGLPPHRLAHR